MSKKHVLCGLHSKGIKVGKCGVWEAHHNKGIRNGQERPGTRVKEIEFEREIPAFQKPERPRCVLVASTLSPRGGSRMSRKFAEMKRESARDVAETVIEMSRKSAESHHE